MRPVQVPDDHIRPDHIRPDQTSLDHIRPDHIRPDQLVAAQSLPVKLAPDHIRPFQVPPVQAVPAVRRDARVAVLTASPKMSRSPFRTTPLSTRCAVPRALSRVPVPVELVELEAAVTEVTDRALVRSRVPLPWAAGLRVPAVRFRVVVVSRALTWLLVQVGCCCRTRAAAPDMTAVAWLVPLPACTRR
jgi:hypothetical protein